MKPCTLGTSAGGDSRVVSLCSCADQQLLHCVQCPFILFHPPYDRSIHILQRLGMRLTLGNVLGTVWNHLLPGDTVLHIYNWPAILRAGWGWKCWSVDHSWPFEAQHHHPLLAQLSLHTKPWSSGSNVSAYHAWSKAVGRKESKPCGIGTWQSEVLLMVCHFMPGCRCVDLSEHEALLTGFYH